MKRRPMNSAGSIVGTALKAFALVSLARSVGPRRIGRLAALASEGYLTHVARRRGNRKHPSTK